MADDTISRTELLAHLLAWATSHGPWPHHIAGSDLETELYNDVVVWHRSLPKKDSDALIMALEIEDSAKRHDTLIAVLAAIERKEVADPAPGDHDTVDHPSHYGGASDPYEVIKVIDAWGLGFSLGNAVKYIARAGKKDPSKHIEDLEKARWYLDHEIQRLRGDP